MHPYLNTLFRRGIITLYDQGKGLALSYSHWSDTYDWLQNTFRPMKFKAFSSLQKPSMCCLCSFARVVYCSNDQLLEYVLQDGESMSPCLVSSSKTISTIILTNDNSTIFITSDLLTYDNAN